MKFKLFCTGIALYVSGVAVAQDLPKPELTEKWLGTIGIIQKQVEK